jgi:hypothetical protein
METCAVKNIGANETKEEIKARMREKNLHEVELRLRMAQEAQTRSRPGDSYYLLSFYHLLSFALYWIEEYNFQDVFLHLSKIDDFKSLEGAEQMGLVLFISYGDSIKIQKLKNIEN